MSKYFLKVRVWGTVSFAYVKLNKTKYIKQSQMLNHGDKTEEDYSALKIWLQLANAFLEVILLQSVLSRNIMKITVKHAHYSVTKMVIESLES